MRPCRAKMGKIRSLRLKMDRSFTLFKNAPAAALTATEEQSASGPGGMPAGGEEAGCASLIKESHREGLVEKRDKKLVNRALGAQSSQVGAKRSILIVNRDGETGRCQQGKGCLAARPPGSVERGQLEGTSSDLLKARVAWGPRRTLATRSSLMFAENAFPFKS